MIRAFRSWWNAPAVRYGHVDPLLAAVSVALMGFGVVMVYSASAIEATVTLGDAEYYLRRQAMFACIGVAVMFAVSRIHYRSIRLLTYPLFLGALALMSLSVLGFGHEGKGAARWLALGPIRVQPAELAKLSLILWLGYSLAKKAERVKTFFVGVFPHLLVLLFVGVLCLAQPDFGSAAVMGAITIIMMLVAGARWRYLITLLVGGVILAAYAITDAAYRMGRIDAWRNIIENRHGGAYQLYQSLLSFGSGGSTGLGLGHGYQGMYLPEAHTDFISAIIGEELGFIGVLLVCGAFFTIVVRGVRLSLTAPDEYSAYVSFGVSCLFGLQALINLMVAMTIAPTKGLTLPFISYGGSSLVVSAAAMGILLSVSRHREGVTPGTDEADARFGGSGAGEPLRGTVS